MLTDHPDRALILEEVHARPFDLLPVSCRLRRLVFLLAGTSPTVPECFERFNAFCTAKSLGNPTSSARQYSFDTADHHVTWEFHNEFITVTWRGVLEDRNSAPDNIGLEILAGGLLVAATRLDLLEEAAIPEPLIPGFQLTSFCVSTLDAGEAQVATDFVPDQERFIRFEVAASRLDVVRRSLLVRRLLEIDCYRTLALLGLPLARRLTPDLRRIERELSGLVDAMANNDPVGAQSTLKALHHLSVQSGQLSQQMDYRFSAGRAYDTILQDRLAALEEVRSTQGTTLRTFISTRVNPAIATCDAMSQRLAVVSNKIERAVGLLNVKIGVDVQMQNAALLNSIDRSARSQFLLQRTVEGLSVIAISYYLLGIAAYLLGGPAEIWRLPKAILLTSAVPLVILSVWFIARWVRAQHRP
ncbi:DUF3422 domain-containing protein [Devosia naphthalenivorans]|uniref:DUF3422 domain-containing protein n=1 Tax=Devosia naphthalenivorans TaxID=2082392 RepID=UPI000D3D43DB|nr:DUF3422 domain-containing protein [Devosia naphthalenivorans]